MDMCVFVIGLGKQLWCSAFTHQQSTSTMYNHVCTCICSDSACDGLDQAVGPDEESFIQDLVGGLDNPQNASSGKRTRAYVLHVYIVDVHVYTCTLCILVMTHTCTYNIFMCEYSFLYCETVPEVIEEDVYAHIRYTDLADELKLVEKPKCIAYIWALLQLLGEKCREHSCTASILDTQVAHCGFCVKITWKCADGHPGSWYSSPIYGSGFGINYLVNTALLVSGGAVTQFHRFCDFLRLCRESQDCFYRYSHVHVHTCMCTV